MSDKEQSPLPGAGPELDPATIERERITTLIDKEIEEWGEGKYWQDYNAGAIRALKLVRELITGKGYLEGEGGVAQ